jgi:hexosaminidase
MKHIHTLAFLLAFVAVGAQTNKPSVIPKPLQMVEGRGGFDIRKARSVTVSSSDTELNRLAAKWADRLSAAVGRPIPVNRSGNGGTFSSGIHFSLNTTPDSSLGDEGYRLLVREESIRLSANRPVGIFYGLQTLLQMCPPVMESDTLRGKVDAAIPSVEIVDRPRFGWRGLMLDVSRHFFDKGQVKDFIDEMVRYKFNILHWHLTDDDGWRIEIKSYPELTKKGAWNVKRVGYYGNFPAPLPNEKRDQGGFYTQEDVREIVSYARERFVDIVPEIDVPGHSLAAVASYPMLSCTPEAAGYSVRSGEQIRYWEDGKPIGLVDNTLCPAKEEVYVFIDKVFGEVASLFPFEYIHMGGDECATNFWSESGAVKELMQREGLKSMDEVQGYFMKRVAKIIESKGKKAIGWDEIVEGGIPPNTMVMSWRDTTGGIRASKSGHSVVMTPKSHVYLDFMQGDRLIEPYSFTISSLRNTYSFEPVPKGAVPSLIKGAQGNLWTEQVYNSRHLQYMLWPRGMALAEVIWSPAGQRDWSDFQRRVEEHFQRLDERGVKYSKSLYDPTFEIMVKGNDSLFVKLSVEAENLKIHYSVDNTHPDAFYPVYDGPIYIPKEASMLKVVTSREGRIMGRQIDFPVTEMLDRVKHRDGPKAKANREKKKYKNVIAAQAAVIIALLLSIFLMARKIRARSRG